MTSVSTDVWRQQWRRIVATGLVVFAWANVSHAQTAANILVVTNAASPASLEIADYYVQARHVPPDQVVRLTLPLTDEISRASYSADIENPISQWLTVHAAQDRILYIVLTKDVPLRITGTGGSTGTVASVDSELTLLYRKLSGAPTSIGGLVKNPYFAGETPLVAIKHFSHQSHDIFLVTRLDGYTTADVKAVIDRGIAPQQQGVVLLDGRVETSQSPGNRWLITAAGSLRKIAGWEQRAILDTSAKALDGDSVIGYYSWGSSDPARTSRHVNVRFSPGAIGGEFVSTDARTFREPPADWLPNNRPFWGSAHSLVGDLIRDGLTGVAGYVAEPYLGSTVRPDVLFPAYVRGANLAEAFYLAMPSLSWTGVVIGDPLCAPFAVDAVAASDLNPPIDTVTGLPQFLSNRRVAALTEDGVKAAAAKLVAQSEVRLANGDNAGMQTALEQATALDDSYVDGHVKLAALYAEAQAWDSVVDRLRRVVTKNPTHPTALNDLAYTLAVHKNAPAEALPFAKRAFSLPVPRPEAADTLAWIYHLLGQDADAVPFITSAMPQLSNSAEVQLHGAIILLASGNVDAAARALDAAVAADLTLNQRQDVSDLRTKINELR